MSDAREMGLPGPVPRVDAAVRHAREALQRGDFATALSIADGMLAEVPDNRDLLYLSAVAKRRCNRIPEALAALTHLEKVAPAYGRLFEERGHCLLALGDTSAALAAFRRAVECNDTLGASWGAIRDLSRARGHVAEARDAEHCLRRLADLPPALARGSDLLNDGELDAAESVVRNFLQASGSHADGMRLLAQIAIKLDVLDDAEFLLQNVLDMAPDYHEARYEYATVLSKRRRHLLSLQQTQRLLQVEPGNHNYRLLYAQARDGIGDYDEALRIYRDLLPQFPQPADLHLSIAQVFRARGDQQAAIESCRAAARVKPGLGAAYWSLTNLKTYRFTSDEVTRMLAMETATSALVDQYHLCFALGKAFEDSAQFGESFRYYDRGNALKKSVTKYRPEITQRNFRLQASVCTREFFASRRGVGCMARDPIFVVGLPRSGSTLLEQILASHSKVDGTMELPDIPRIAHLFRNRNGEDAPPRYPAVLADVDAEELRQLGEDYIEQTRVYRKGAPFFIDKMPSNFRDIGLIHLILPNAKIIDARREPMACCFGNFKQLFTRGQEFTYSLTDVARYYRDYVELMDHWDRALPGKVLRVRHEDVVADLEGSVRRMLEFCGLDFEPACLEFHKTARTVRTISSEQVRRPIYREGLHLWRNYEPWLEPLKIALGPLAPSLPGS